MSNLEYMIGERGEDLSGPMELKQVFEKLDNRLAPDRHYRIKRKGGDWSFVRDGRETYSRVKEVLPKYPLGETLLIENVRWGKVLAIRVVVAASPAMPTTGTPAIDKIYGTVMSEFDDELGIINMGICADKPGEHHECNAWDIGVRKPNSSDDIHRGILKIANWLRDNTFSGEELPNEGIIVMSQWCERGSRSMSSWMTYHGTPHVSHVHVSGHPGRVSGWI